MSLLRFHHLPGSLRRISTISHLHCLLFHLHSFCSHILSQSNLSAPRSSSLPSTPSHYIFHCLSSKTLIGSLILPEIPFSGNSAEPSVGDKSCNIYSLNDADKSTLLISLQFLSVLREPMLFLMPIGEQIMIPGRVLILDSVQTQSFWGKLSPDETYAFKLETSSERKVLDNADKSSSLLKGLEYFPSGSMVDGLAAALLAQCQMRNIRGALCVSWPEYGGTVVQFIKSILQRNVLHSVDLSSNGDAEDEYSRFSQI